MLTLSYGFKKPQDGDKGSIFWDALADDIQQLNDHTHNGVDSALLSSSAMTGLTQSVLAAGWVHQGGGTYRQLVNTPGGRDIDNYQLSFKDANGHQLVLTVEKVTDSSFYVYINDNTVDLTAMYGF